MFIWLIFMVATLILVIVMLNLLIAFISDSYDDVVSKKDSAFLFERCEIIYHIDEGLDDEEKIKLHDDLKDKYLFIATQIT